MHLTYLASILLAAQSQLAVAQAIISPFTPAFNMAFPAGAGINLDPNCPNAFASCANIGEPWFCCPNSSRCTFDDAKDVACCPYGNFCRGVINYATVGTELTVPATTAMVVATTVLASPAPGMPVATTITIPAAEPVGTAIAGGGGGGVVCAINGYSNTCAATQIIVLSEANMKQSSRHSFLLWASVWAMVEIL